jgi:hypothetical protein
VVSESQRLGLHAAARATLGGEEGDTLMSLVPPANTDIATRQDVEHAQVLMSAQLGETRVRMEALDDRLTGQMQALDERLTGQMQALDERLTGQMQALDDRLTGQMQALDDRLTTRMDALERSLDTRIERSELRTRVWTFGIVIAAQALGVSYLSATLG